MDSMIQKLEKYADNLENIVQQRTSELMDEKQKTDMLLYRMLPKLVPQKDRLCGDSYVDNSYLRQFANHCLHVMLLLLVTDARGPEYRA